MESGSIKFQVIIGLKDLGLHDDFKDAFKEFYEKMKEVTKRGYSISWLYTNFIVFCLGDEGESLEIPLDFNRVSSLARLCGLMKTNGELVSNYNEIEVSDLKLMATLNEAHIDLLSAEYSEEFLRRFDL